VLRLAVDALPTVLPPGGGRVSRTTSFMRQRSTRGPNDQLTCHGRREGQGRGPWPSTFLSASAAARRTTGPPSSAASRSAGRAGLAAGPSSASLEAAQRRLLW